MDIVLCDYVYKNHNINNLKPIYLNLQLNPYISFQFTDNTTNKKSYFPLVGRFIFFQDTKTRTQYKFYVHLSELYFYFSVLKNVTVPILYYASAINVVGVWSRNMPYGALVPWLSLKMRTLLKF